MTSRALVGAALVFVVSVGASSWADAKSAPLVEDAKKKLRARDLRGALTSVAAAVAADPADADAQFLQEDLLRRNATDEALAAQYRAKAAAHADDALAACLVARLLDADSAAKEFAKIAARFPASPLPHEGRALALELLPRDKDREKDIADELDQAASLGPREPRFSADAARNFERVGQWTDAVAAWKAALTMRPTDRDFILGLGEALRRTGALDDAVAQFEAAGKLDPTDAEPPYRIGLARLDAVRPADALKSFDASIALDRRYVDAYRGAVRAALSVAHSGAKPPVEADFSSALDYGNRAVQGDAASAAARLALANAEEAAAEIAPAHAGAALTAYETALGFAPAPARERVEALVGKSYALLLLGRADECVAAADAAIALDDEAVAAYLCAGRALSSKGKQPDAIRKYFTAGLKAVPGDASLLHARGVAAWETQHPSDARRDLEAAVKADPKNGRFQLSLGVLYYELKTYKPAVTALAVAVESRPNDPTAWRAFGRAQTSSKDWQAAADALEKFVALVEPAGFVPAPVAAPAPAAGGDAGKPDPAAAAASPAAADAPKPLVATSEHLQLAMIYADHLNRVDLAKAHAKRFVDEGGTEPDVDDWIRSLLDGK